MEIELLPYTLLIITISVISTVLCIEGLNERYRKQYPRFKVRLNNSRGFYVWGHSPPNTIVLNYGEWAEDEKSVARFIEHETLHWLLLNNHGVIACNRLDYITKKGWLDN